ncbi:MAG: hypothetical protein JRM97_06210 [Nitrososphaerota archaeon]|nr:hypothetical protein [Nitrososphaerota archaeon]MDG6981083.1 hypothetical protein [Nitrososphaerota archaeon]MDG7032204.1 hypothetical protein [Nitrososphaerota archaeon]
MRTDKDRIYRDLTIKHGPLTNVELCRYAKEITGFDKMSDFALEKDVDRLVKYHLEMGTLVRENGALTWLLPVSRPASVGPEPGQAFLSGDGFLTSRAAVKCRRCGDTIDLSTVKKRWRLENRYLALALHVHHFFRVTCPGCGWDARCDTGKDVKPLLSPGS